MPVFKYPRSSKKNGVAMADGGLALASMISPLITSMKLDEQGQMGVLLEKWALIVGRGIAAHARPGRLINKELTIFVDSSPWLSELQRASKKELLSKLQGEFGRDVIQTLRLSMDPGRE